MDNRDEFLAMLSKAESGELHANGIEPIPATVIETRNYIARPNEHKHQTFEFGELRVQL